jgi:predicted RNA-binding protein (virulence factor B family)
MTLQMGDYNTLLVLRETDYAYILGDEETEVFLHKKQAIGTLDIHQEVTVFLYYDGQKRVTATMNKPLIDQERAGFVDVVDTSFRLGAFLDMGLKKDLLLSMDDLPFVKNEWPEKGDKVFAKVKVSKHQLTARLITRYAVKNYLVPETPLEEGSQVEAYNMYRAEEGNVFVTEQGHIIFVYFKHMRKTYRLGEKETITITIDKGQFEYNGTVIEQKELMLDKDAERLATFMEEHDMMMPYTDKTSPKVIQMVFRMSKGAFKRALGTLYKQQLVALDEDKTRLLKPLNKTDK